MIQDGITINRSTLYENYIRMEIRRQSIEKSRELLFKEDARFVLMKILALDLYRKKKTSLTTKEIMEVIRGHFTNQQLQQFEGHVSDFLSCSFLKRTDDSFGFSHQTFLEFFISTILYEEITSRELDLFSQFLISEPILDFLAEKDINEEKLWEIIEHEQNCSKKSENTVVSNCTSVLVRKGISLKKNLKRLNFVDAKLQGANLSRIDLTESDLSYAVLKKCNLTQANLTNAILFQSNLESANLTNANLSCAKMNEANIKNAELSFAVLREADLTKANLTHSSIIKADLSRALLSRVTMLTAKCDNANLSYTDLSHADLRGAWLQNANLEGANLEKANLSGAILYGANLSKSNLTGAILTDANLKHVDLRGANLNTMLFYADLTGIKFDESTIISGSNIDPQKSYNQGLISQEFANYIFNRGVEISLAKYLKKHQSQKG